jgi:HSP20 family protein
MESWAIPLDVVQDDDSIVVTASLPGLEADGIDVSVEDGLLTISGETKADTEKTDGNYVIRERRSGKFHRVVRLPDTVDADRAEPRYVDGVLTIKLPKIEAKKAKRLQIHAG